MRRSPEIWQAELDFVERTRERGAEGWAESFAEDGVQLVPGSDPVVGRAAILQRAAAGMFAKPVDFSWEPLCALVSNDETLGYTYGTWRVKDDDGTVVATGMYTSAWRPDDEGRWVVVADGGFADPVPFTRASRSGSDRARTRTR
jgi:ketosteroid isomerase-like protein